MTSSSLHFGPEWMRKGPSNASKTSNVGTQQSSAATTTPTTTTITTPTTAAPSLSFRRNHVPGLGAMQSSSVGGLPTPVSTPTAVPSPGSFSFAAAAAGGADRAASTTASAAAFAAATDTNGGGSAASSAAAAAAALHHHQHSLSLYSSKEGSRGPLSPSSDSAPGSHSGTAGGGVGVLSGGGGAETSANASGAGSGNGSQGRRKLFPERERDRDRDSRRSLSQHEANAISSPALPPSEPPRGLNARGASVSRDRDAEHRPGLFQRANSSGHFGAAATVPSPTTPRERFSGIQGGVLSGVVPPERRRKESGDVRLPGAESRKHPSLAVTGGAAVPQAPPPLPTVPVEEESLWERRGAGRAVLSSDGVFAESETTSGGRDKLFLEEISTGPTSDVGDQSTSRSAVTPGSASWSSARRRERAPGEGPIGPPADGSAGFDKFAAYERKRERMASHPVPEGWRSMAPVNGINGEQPPTQTLEDKDESQVDKSSIALEGLKIDETGIAASSSPQEQPTIQAPAAAVAWSAETQKWLYRDPSGQVQGPFSATMMQDWYQQSYFNDELLIRAEEEPDFHRLIDVIAAAGNNPQLFLVRPPSMKQPSPVRQPQQTNDLLSAMHNVSSSPYMGPRGPQQGSNGWNDNGWHAAAPQHQQQPGHISTSFDAGTGVFGGSPFLAYAGSTAGSGGLEAPPRQPEEYLAMMRQREIEEYRQQHAAMQAMQQQHTVPAAVSRGVSFGEFPAMDSFVGGWPPAIQQPQEQQQQQPPQDQSWSATQLLWSQRETEPQASDSQHSATWGQVAPSGNTQPIGTPVEKQSLDDHRPVVSSQETHVKSPQQASPLVPTAVEQPSTPQPEDPAPEYEWPQSPSAVEFATEPDMTQPSAAAQNERGMSGKSMSSISTQNATGSITAPRTSTGGNIKVVGADQFRKPGLAAPRSGTEAPLGSFLPVSSQATHAIPAKIAPWAQQTSTQQQDKGSDSSAKSLREIQEAEARQVEARRAAEKAAAAQRRAASNGSFAGSDGTASLPSTMSWGLASIPSSAATVKSDAAAAAAASPPPAAWTDAVAKKSAGTPKKTLTEIQEEERKRTQGQAQLKQAQNAAARKAYLDSATRQTTAPANATPAAASGWSVVGAGGKASNTPSVSAASATPASIPARPTIGATGIRKTTSATKISGVAGAWGASSTNGPSGSSGTPATLPAKPPAATRKNASTSPANGPGTSTVGSAAAAPSTPTPSPEFLRYCQDQLKGLNVKVDDFIEMLLSFPLDPSQDVVDIIADSIYANSSSMDGRRVANDFVAKRKMDAGFRGDVGAASASGSGTNGGAVAGGGNSNSRKNASGGRSPTVTNSAAKGQNGFQQVVKKGGKRK